MHRDLIEILVCPVTKETLHLTIEEANGDEIITGYLYSKSIDFKYQIKEGIPNMLPPAMQEGSTEQ